MSERELEDVGMAQFLPPLLYVETVSEAIVDVLYSGYGGALYLPTGGYEIRRHVAAPEWFFRLVIKHSTAQLGADLRERQVIDVTGWLQAESR
ncbi:hypothetical protein C8A03DRAFT_36238 [Achaetomium macrosporum]|uniref:Uncharacterized protein n=1 Tax=Achaetomium macrosporum TaxID=79813 RepID=A0AAN7C6K1_9PEZI|nr:hypothetical protein C8A03DRAFT_36238 [Achaetomium macrosporum]